MRRLKMFHLVHHLHRVPETERAFCPNLPESRAVGYASHRGKKLTAQQLEEHVRLCIRDEERCQCAECVARRAGE